MQDKVNLPFIHTLCPVRLRSPVSVLVWVYSFVNKPRVLKFGIQLKMDKIYHKKRDTELDMINFDVSMTSCSNLVVNKPKIRPFSVLVRVLFRLS